MVVSLGNKKPTTWSTAKAVHTSFPVWPGKTTPHDGFFTVFPGLFRHAIDYSNGLGYFFIKLYLKMLPQIVVCEQFAVYSYVMDKQKEQSPHSFLEWYIEEGRDITVSTQYGVHSGTDEQFQMGVPLRYSLWKDDVGLFLRKNGFLDEAEFFFEADSVPVMISGLAYGNPLSSQSRLLMKDIREEVSKKLKVLRKVRARLVEVGSEQNNAIARPYFNVDTSRLYVRGKEIKLLKFKDGYQALRVIFNDPNDLSKEWFFSEIREKVDAGEVNDKKYYNAIYQVSLKLKIKGINDFFITTNQSVKINSKYLF